ncbi:hypothetical protein PhCBS80983_g02096 [Powellomyces hirtus]|uniref:Diphthine--ammonia ligase n=1 Tax=Powellomyces hirtus TaxID=109895 RepID=A0A507EAD9_9FUNG|nr:hypothetical protein PhCBS80983_g02096 [Powellomyces hirtus]
MPNITLSFTGGKDSVLALHMLSALPAHHISLLITFAPANAKPFLSHPIPLIQTIADALDIPHRIITIHGPDYLGAYVKEFETLKNEGFDAVATGDIEDVCNDFVGRAAKAANFPLLRPLWQIPRPTLLNHLFTTHRLTFITTCVNTSKIPSEFAGSHMIGRTMTHEFLSKTLPAALPEIDACGENGEFHTMVLDAPLFKKRVVIDAGQGKADESGDYMFWAVDAFHAESKVIETK